MHHILLNTLNRWNHWTQFLGTAPGRPVALFHALFHPLPYALFSALFSALLTAVMALACTTASAQTSGNVSVVSNYLFRGFTRSNGHPAPQLSLAYDSPSGWYAGAFASGVDIQGDSGHTQLIGYGGYAQKWSTSVSWEFGATQTTYQQFAKNNYAEVFTGLTSENFSGRVYYSPNYLGESIPSLYTEVNAHYPLEEHLQLLAHVGHLHVPSGNATLAASRFDSSVGIGATMKNWSIQLAYVVVTGNHMSYVTYDPDSGSDNVHRVLNSNPHTGVATLSYSF
jgi:uncharacterized protein (TIGR02001 family)